MLRIIRSLCNILHGDLLFFVFLLLSEEGWNIEGIISFHQAQAAGLSRTHGEYLFYSRHSTSFEPGT